MKSQKRRQTVNKGSTLDFGKFRGKTLGYILANEPSYIVWLSRNVEFITLEEELLDEAKHRVTLEEAVAEAMLPPNWR